jgi:thioesterase domain-containing protein
LIAIEPQGNRPPFFCIHGITGDVLWFRDLARCFAPDYPFYGFQARGLDGVQEPFSEIEAMAAFYIEEMRLLQPKGPYFLGGASFGGAVALEIAQQLHKQGEEVALLAIFDQSPPNIRVNSGNENLKGRIIKSFKLIRNLPHWFGDFVNLGPSRMLLRVRRKLRQARKLTRGSDPQNQQLFDAADFIDFADELSVYRQQLIVSHYQAKQAYQPGAYEGRVTLFRATVRPLLSTYDPEAAWKEIARGPLDVINVPSSHEGMFRTPHVNFLAEQLKQRIDQAFGKSHH